MFIERGRLRAIKKLLQTFIRRIELHYFMEQPFIYQQFSLDMAGKEPKDLKSKPGDLEKVTLELVNRGFEVLPSCDTINGLPEHILIGNSVHSDHKGVFYGLIAPFNWPYRSGPAFADFFSYGSKPRK
jgi:hypothetical protein